MPKARAKKETSILIAKPSAKSPAKASVKTAAEPSAKQSNDQQVEQTAKSPPHFISLFLEHLRIDKGSSIHTLKAYERDLLQFQKQIEMPSDRGLNQNSSPLLQATEVDLQKFLKKLTAAKQKSTSIARKISALKQFYKFLVL